MAEDLSTEILTLEDEKLALEQNLLIEYSHGAGLHPVEVPVITSLDVPKVDILPFADSYRSIVAGLRQAQ